MLSSSGSRTPEWTTSAFASLSSCPDLLAAGEDRRHSVVQRERPELRAILELYRQSHLVLDHLTGIGRLLRGEDLPHANLADLPCPVRSLNAEGSLRRQRLVDGPGGTVVLDRPDSAFDVHADALAAPQADQGPRRLPGIDAARERKRENRNQNESLHPRPLAQPPIMFSGLTTRSNVSSSTRPSSSPASFSVWPFLWACLAIAAALS